MQYGLDLDFDQLPTELHSLLPLDEWCVEYEMDRDELLVEVELTFEVERSSFHDDYGHFYGPEEVVFTKVTLNDVEVPVEWAEKLLGDMTPEEMSQEWLSDNAPEPNWMI
jgi:hypothetical protein